MAYIIRRLLQAIPVLFLASLPIFFVLHAAPGDPALIIAGEDASQETIAAVRQEFGLDKPLYEQYIRWLGHVVRGDLGRSYLTDIPVTQLIQQRLPATFQLALTSVLLAIILAIPTGVAAALKRGKWIDYLVTASSSLAIAIPNFWLGVILILVFSLYLGWLPAGGRFAMSESPVLALKTLILPAVTLSLYVAASLSRFGRSSMLEILHQDFVRTARSKGVPSRSVIYRHALRNALIPMVTVLGAHFGRLMSGAIIVESIFTWPGLGSLMLDSIRNRDYIVIQGTLLVFIITVIVVNLLTDLAYGVLDPRLRLNR